MIVVCVRRYGMRFIVKSSMSDGMIKKIFDRMDKGTDHLGTMCFSDSSLAYQEFYEKVRGSAVGNKCDRL